MTAGRPTSGAVKVLALRRAPLPCSERRRASSAVRQRAVVPARDEEPVLQKSSATTPTPAEHQTNQTGRARVQRHQTSTKPRVSKQGTLDAGATALDCPTGRWRLSCNKPGSRQVTHGYVRSAHGSIDRGSISNSQADSAGSIPVNRSTQENRYSKVTRRHRGPGPVPVGPRRS